MYVLSFFCLFVQVCSQVAVRIFWFVSIKLTDATFYQSSTSELSHTYKNTRTLSACCKPIIIDKPTQHSFSLAVLFMFLFPQINAIFQILKITFTKDIYI